MSKEFDNNVQLLGPIIKKLTELFDPKREKLQRELLEEAALMGFWNNFSLVGQIEVPDEVSATRFIEDHRKGMGGNTVYCGLCCHSLQTLAALMKKECQVSLISENFAPGKIRYTDFKITLPRINEK